MSEAPGAGAPLTGISSKDAVNHPEHYNSHPAGIECIDVVEHMTFNIGNATKYLWRSGLKDGVPVLQDLRKARWYIDREIERLTAHHETPAPEAAVPISSGGTEICINAGPGISAFMDHFGKVLGKVATS